MLEIKNLSYQYQNTDKEIAGNRSNIGQSYHYDLQMSAGSCAAVIGESGAGKSTLLALIAGFLSAEFPGENAHITGEVNLEKQSLLSLPAGKRPVSILFQKDNLFNHLSVWQNIALGLSPKMKLTAAQKTEIEQALQRTELAHLQNRLPENLSGGQQQRIALLRCLLRQQPILLLDEPFTGLNQALRTEYAGWINDYKTKHNAYIIWVTHDFDDVVGVADQWLEMKEKKIGEN